MAGHAARLQPICSPPTLAKRPVFGAPVKKTYLTLVYLTVVLASKINGFVLEKKNFREDVQKTPPLLKWAHVQIMPHNRDEGMAANSSDHEEHEEREERHERALLRGLRVLRG